MRIAILAYPGCVASGVSGFVDVLAMANHVLKTPRFTATVLSEDGQPVTPFAGAPISVDGATRSSDPAVWDLVFAPPAFGVTAPPELLARWLAEAHSGGAVVTGACAGVFLLAQAGVLGDRAATTHWGLADTFAQRHPEPRLEPDRLLIDGGDYMCAGGVTAYHDLALHITARFAGTEIAAQCARILLLDPGRTSQAPYRSLVAPANHGDDAVMQAQTWLEDRSNQPLRLSELAQAVHVSERTLLRRFKKATLLTPGGYLQAIRMERAKRLLESSGLSVNEIVHEVGYNDTSAFYRLFKSLTGLAPGEYRRRFGLSGRPEEVGTR